MPSRQSVVRKQYLRELWKFGYVVCGICSKWITTEDDLTVDHIIPTSLGGKNGSGNMQPAHFGCNQEKGAQEGFYIKEKDIESHSK